MRKLGRLLWLVLLLITAAAGIAETDICGFPVMGRVTIARTDRVLAHFDVTLAQTRERRRQGLMECSALAPGSGMLFIYPDARRRSFWMKNTPIELAIVYITERFFIAAIERGEPENTASILSPEGIQFVLEINFVEAAALAVGDRVNIQLTHPIGAPQAENDEP